MHLTRQIKIQLIIFIAIGLVAAGILGWQYIRLPSLLFGVGQYNVTVELPEAAGLYPRGVVTYRGTEVGRVQDVRLTDDGVVAILALESTTAIPSDVDAEVHSQSAVGEQYVALVPRADAPPLRDGDVIGRDRTSVPPNINALLDATNDGLLAIPQGNLKTVVDESAIALGGLGPDLSRLIKGASALAAGARANTGPLTALIDQSQPILQSQVDSADSIQQWSSHLAEITKSLRSHDDAVSDVLTKGAPAAQEVRHLLDRVQPTLPIILANMVSIGEVTLAYNASIEQVLVLLPMGTAAFQAISVPNHNTKLPGAFFDFNLNVNLPPTCGTGYLPPQQQRPPALEDWPDRPTEDIYCRIPQDAPFNVRGMRNIPCATVPGKRAPTAAMCESSENYVPLNDGMNWKGDPNATTTGQSVPQGPPTGPPLPGAVPPGPEPPVVAGVIYDPATGSYVGPDGKTYQRTDLAGTASKDKTWQSMILPPAP